MHPIEIIPRGTMLYSDKQSELPVAQSLSGFLCSVLNCSLSTEEADMKKTPGTPTVDREDSGRWSICS